MKQKLDLSATVSDKKNYKSKKGKANENVKEEVDEILDVDELQVAQDRIPDQYMDSNDKWAKATHTLQSYFNMLTPSKPDTPLVELLKVDEKIRFS